MTNNCTKAFGPVQPSKLELMGIRFAELGGDGSGAGGDGAGDGGESKTQGQTFKQEDVDRIVKERLDRERAKFADYDDLKAKAEGAKTLEDKVADLTAKITESEAKALRSAIAAEYGVSTKKGPNGEPSDADLFLTGSDEATLTAQASRLAAQVAEQKKQGNRAPKEGGTTTQGNDDTEMREFARNLFGRAD